MERPKLTEEQIEANNVKLAELSEVAEQIHGPDAQFAYENHEGKKFIMTFDEAIQACGRHMADESVEKALQVLAELRANYEEILVHPYKKELLARGLKNAQQKLAERALASE